MPAAPLSLVIDQGEDYSAQIVWTDDYDEPHNVVAPCRMDIKDSLGSTLLTLATPDEEPPPGVIPAIGLSSDIGMIQLHIPKEITSLMLSGEYHYDLFVSVDDGAVYAGNQVSRLLYGGVTVNKRFTQL